MLLIYQFLSKIISIDVVVSKIIIISDIYCFIQNFVNIFFVWNVKKKTFFLNSWYQGVIGLRSLIQNTKTD